LSKQIETLVDDIYHLLDENTDHTPSEENLEWFAETVKNVLRTKLSKRERNSPSLRFSSLGKKDRQLWYSTHVPEKAERLSPETYLKFLYGDFFEALLLFLAKESGHEVTGLQSEVEADGILGHIDAIVDGVVVDVKSASPYGYQKFVSGLRPEDDAFGYLQQLAGYRNVLNVDRAGFLAANKVNGKIVLSEVDSDVLDEYQPEPRIAHLREVLEQESPPERCYSDKPDGKSGNRILDTGCSYCSFKALCWQDSNGGDGLRTYFYSTGPRYFTHIEKEPRVAKEEF
jgi:hypothetical protein